jgi:hypothetical protein
LRHTVYKLFTGHFKLEAFRELTETNLISKTESLVETYRAFRDELPEYIIDPMNLFPVLREKIPILFGQYEVRLVTVGTKSYKIYYR